MPVGESQRGAALCALWAAFLIPTYAAFSEAVADPVNSSVVDDPVDETAKAAAYMESGKRHSQLGETEEAFRDLEQCLAIVKERVKIEKGSDRSRRNLANTYFQLALSSEELRRDMNAALAYNQDGLKLYEDIDAHPMLENEPVDRRVVRMGLAEAHMRVGVTQYRLGEPAAALGHYRKAHDLRRDLADEEKGA